MGYTMTHRRSRVLLLSGAILCLTGCGAPDLQSMRPSAAKPTALVVLVDKPVNWTPAVVDNATSNTNVVTHVVETTSTNMQREMDKYLQQTGIGLFVVVSDSAIDSNMLNRFQNDMGHRFELFSPNPSDIKSSNVRQIGVDDAAVSYGAGWLAGTLAADGGGVNSVGWLSDNTSATQDQKRAVLAGLYTANTTVSLVNVQPLLDPTMLVGIPPVVITDGSLSNTQLGWLHNANVKVVSLRRLAQATNLAAEPGTTDPSLLSSDIKQFASMQWKSGTTAVLPNPVLQVDPSVVTQSERASLDVQFYNWTNSAQSLSTRFGMIPTQLQSTWSGVVGLSR